MNEGGPAAEEPAHCSEGRVAFAFKTNEYITDYIKFADAKAGTILTFVAAVGGIVAWTARPLLAAAHRASGCVSAVGCLIGGFVFVGVFWTAWNALSAVHPRAAATAAAQPPLHSFPDLAVLDAKKAIARMEGMTDGEMAADVMSHSVTLARLAAVKFAALGRASVGLRISVLSSACWALLYAVASVLGMEQTLGD